MDGPCLYLGADALAASGAVAVTPEGDGLSVRRARDDSRGRIWGGSPGQ
jgi:hypothetical protein